jgi:hypothetical protein
MELVRHGGADVTRNSNMHKGRRSPQRRTLRSFGLVQRKNSSRLREHHHREDDESERFAREMLRAERLAIATQLGRRIWAPLPYQVTRTPEEKRQARAGRIKPSTMVVPSGPSKEKMRTELSRLEAAYLALGGPITQCPAETTTAKLHARPRGRPSVHTAAMDNAERSSRKRGKRKINEAVRPWFVGGRKLRVELLGQPSTDALRTTLRAVHAVRDRIRLRPDENAHTATSGDNRRCRTSTHTQTSSRSC